MPRKRRTRSHVLADLSVNHVERHVLAAGFAVDRVEHDYGFDLALYTYAANGEVENGHVLMQLKATDAISILADGATIAFRVERADLQLWLPELMPVILIVYDATRERAYWLYVQAHFEELRQKIGFDLAQVGNTVTVHLPLTRVVDEAAIRTFARYKAEIQRQSGEWFITMTEEVRFKALERLLLRLGFVAGDLPSGHKAFLHRPTDTLILLPAYAADDRVGAHHLVSIRRMVVERGVADGAFFENLLKEAAEPAPLLTD